MSREKKTRALSRARAAIRDLGLPARFAVVIAVGAALTFAGILFVPAGSYRLVAFAYLLYISLSALFLRTPYVVLIAASSVLAWNFAFMAPRFGFGFEQTEDFILLVMFFVNAIIIGTLTSRLRENEERLRLRGKRLYALYDLARDINRANSPEETTEAAERHVGDFFGERVSLDAITDGTGVSRARGQIEDADFLNGATELVRLSLARHEYRKIAESAKLSAETERLYAVMLNLVSHELRTPLTTVIGAATTLSDPFVESRAEARHALQDEILAAATKLDRLLDNLLSMSRIESGHLRLDLRDYPVQDIINAAIKSVSGEKPAGQGLSCEIPDDIPPVAADFGLLERVFANLLRNSYLYAGAVARVGIAALLRDGRLEVIITDDGPGFPADILDRPFVKFKRGHGVAPGGLGLGLSICASILEAHGGELSIANGPGGGARCRAALPVFMQDGDGGAR